MVDAPSTAPLLIFDGDCGFCTTSVDWMTRTLPGMPRSIPYQWADLDAYGLTPADGRAMVWLVTDEEQFGGASAIAALLRHQAAAAPRFLGWLATVPPWSFGAELAYRLVARFRYRLPGGTPACRVPGTR